MEQTDQKLQTFSKIVTKEALNEKNKILKETDKELKELLDKKEIEFLTDAYQSIQNELHSILRENNQLFSRAVMEGKQLLFKKRTKIIDEVFDNILDKINKFKKKPEYKEFMKKNIKKGYEAVGKKEVEITVNEEDRKTAEEILKETGMEYRIITSDNDITGGSIAYSKKERLLYDNSIAVMIEKEKNEFLKHFNISID